ncbi:MAG: hypothetical protein ACXIT9_08250 [Nitritalea sp.]
MHSFRSKLKTLLRPGAFFLLTLLALDFSIGEGLYALYQQATFGVSATEYYTVMKSREELLIFGSSRAANHYHPQLIEEVTGLTTYNAGREGTGIHYHHAVLGSVLERHQPQAVVLEVNYSDIYVSKVRFNEQDLHELRPFYNKVSANFDRQIAYNWYDKFLLQSRAFRFNKKFIRILSGNVTSVREELHGFRPLEGSRPLTLAPYKVPETLDAKKMAKLEAIVTLCQQRDVPLFLVISPFYATFPEEVFAPVYALAERRQVPILDLLASEEFLARQEYFYDRGHLNRQGAEKFSLEIAQLLPLPACTSSSGKGSAEPS